MTHAGHHFCQRSKAGLTVIAPWRRLLDVRFKLFPALSFRRCIVWTWYGNYFDLAHFITAKSIKQINQIGIGRIKLRSILSCAWIYYVI